MERITNGTLLKQIQSMPRNYHQESPSWLHHVGSLFSRDCNSPLCLRRRSLILLSRNSIFLCKLSSSYTFGVLNSQPGLTNKLTSLQSTIISSLSLVSPISGERLSWLYLHSKLKKLVLMTWNKCHQKFFGYWNSPLLVDCSQPLFLLGEASK